MREVSLIFFYENVAILPWRCPLLGINPADSDPAGPPDKKEKIIYFNIYLLINEELLNLPSMV
jgi:hypothetical protein